MYGCRRVPYQEKHALQQASLLGNMEAFGLLKNLNEEELGSKGSCPSESISGGHGAKQRAVVELGAGRGYLSHMLCDCYTVHKVVMVERRAYKFKVLIISEHLKCTTLQLYCCGDFVTSIYFVILLLKTI